MSNIVTNLWSKLSHSRPTTIIPDPSVGFFTPGDCYTARMIGIKIIGISMNVVTFEIMEINDPTILTYLVVGQRYKANITKLYRWFCCDNTYDTQYLNDIIEKPQTKDKHMPEIINAADGKLDITDTLGHATNENLKKKHEDLGSMVPKLSHAENLGYNEPVEVSVGVDILTTESGSMGTLVLASSTEAVLFTNGRYEVHKWNTLKKMLLVPVKPKTLTV